MIAALHALLLMVPGLVFAAVALAPRAPASRLRNALAVAAGRIESGNRARPR